MIALIVGIAANLLGGTIGYLAAAMRRNLPLTGWLDRLPAPRWPRRTPKTPPRAHGGAGDPRTAFRRLGGETGARRTRTGTAAAAPAAVPAKAPAPGMTLEAGPERRRQTPRETEPPGDCTRDNPRAAGAASARGAQPSGRRSSQPMPMAPRGRHHASEPLTVRFSVGGERADGTWVHGDTGPLDIAGYGADLKSAKRLVAP